jgi:hypothetical protein
MIFRHKLQSIRTNDKAKIGLIVDGPAPSKKKGKKIPHPARPSYCVKYDAMPSPIVWRASGARRVSLFGGARHYFNRLTVYFATETRPTCIRFAAGI